MVHKGDSAEWFMDFCRFKGKRYIFGTGTQAINTMFLLKLVYERVDGALVSKVKDRNFCDVPVCSIDEFEASGGCAVLLAVSKTIAQEILPVLEKHGASEIYLCTDWEQANDQIKEHIFLSYLEEINIDFVGDEITLGKCRFINPLKHKKYYRQMLMGTTFSDIILPGIMRDDRYDTRGVYDLVEGAISGVNQIVDVGANAGVFSAYAASLGKNVLAIDASRTIFPFLKRNASLSKTVEALEIVVSDCDGKMNFYDIETYPKYSSTKPKNSACVYEQQSMMLDTIVIEKEIKPEFIRLDIGEDSIRAMRGCKDTIEKYHPYLLFWDTDGLIEEIEKIDTLVGYEKESIGGHVFFTWKGIE